MAWTSLTTLEVNANWQYTEPVTGRFFRLKHTGFRLDDIYVITQIELATDGSIALMDEWRELKPAFEPQVVELVSLPIYTERRVAIKRLPKPTGIEAELRRVLRNALLEEAEPQIIAPRRSNWQVAVEVSDYVEPAPAPAQTTTPSAPEITLTYASNGDENGLFYFLGTNKKTTTWSNPISSGKIAVIASSTGSGSQPIDVLADRAINSTGFYTSNIANSWIVVDVGTDKSITPKYASLRHRTSNSRGYYLRNWKWQGSNNAASNSIADLNAATWTDLDVQTNNTSIDTEGETLSLPINSSAGYRRLRLIQTGTNSSNDNGLALDEIELYGILKG